MGLVGVWGRLWGVAGRGGSQGRQCAVVLGGGGGVVVVWGSICGRSGLGWMAVEVGPGPGF